MIMASIHGFSPVKYLRRTWGMVAAATITAGAGIYSASQNGGAPGVEDKYTQGPNFQANQDVVGQWKNWLTGQNADNNYGAISPDWNDIWQQTQQQVKEYYNGNAMTPGINDGIKGSFAQRGMGGQAGETFALAASGANEAQQLNNASMQQNISKQTFANQGKNDWLNSMNNFTGATNGGAGQWSGAIPYATTGQQVGNAVGSAASGLGSYYAQQQSQQQQNNWMQSMINGSGNSGADNSDYALVAENMGW